MLKRVTRIFWYTGAALVIVAALLLSAARLVLPMLDDYQDELQQWLTARIGQPVTIERLDLGWHGLGPDLQLINTTLYDEAGEHSILHLQELRIGVNLWRSWREQQLVTSRIGLYGSDLNLIRREDGRIVLRGKETITPLVNPVAVILAQPRIELRNVSFSWEDRMLGQPRVAFNELELSLRNRNARHQLHLVATPVPSLGKALEVQADLVVPQGNRARFSGKVYARAEGLLLREWLSRYLSDRWYIGGVMDGRVWASLNQGRLASIKSELSVNLPVFSVQTQAAPLFSGVRLDTHLDWNRVGAQGWQLSLNDTVVTQATRTWPSTGLTLVMGQGEDKPQRLQLAVGEVDLDLLRPLLPLLDIDTDTRTTLEALAPQGRLRDLQLGGERQNGKWRDIRFKAQLKDLGWQAHGKIPALSSIQAEVIGSPDTGRIALNLQQGQFKAPNLFRSPLPLQRVDGVIHWQRLRDRLRVTSRDFKLANADIKGEGRLLLDFPASGGKPFMDLQVALEKGHAAMTSRYLPVGIMHEKTVHWLDQAIVSGNIISGGVMFHGRLGDFPFDHGEGRMEIRARVRNGILDYHPEWHRIEEIEAQLVFVNRSMHIDAVAGTILGTQLSDVKVDIANLKHSIMQISGHARGPLSDMLRFVQDSPLSNKGYALGMLQGSGAAGLDLQLEMPLYRHHTETTQVKGKVRLAGNTIELRPWDLRFDNVSGRLGFTESGVTAPELDARLWDTPVKVRIARHPAAEDLTRISLDGELPVIRKLADARLKLAQHLTGKSDWHVQLDVGKQTNGYHLTVDSDLKGIAVDLPAPLAKPANTARRLRVTTHLRQQEVAPFYVNLGPHTAALDLDLNGTVPRLVRGTVLLNRGPATLPEGRGMVVKGTLDYLSLDAWKALLGDTGGGAMPDITLQAADLEIERLEAFNQTFDQVALTLEPALSGWDLNLSGPDIAGTAVIPKRGSTLPVDLDLSRLVLQRHNGRTPEADRIDPANVPPLDVHIKKLRYGDLELGEVQMKSDPVAYGMEVHSLKVDGDWLDLSAQGNWTLRDKREASRFDVEVHGGNLGRMLTAFGYSGNIEGGETHGEINANWPGSPMDFKLEKVEGSLSLRIGEGQLVKFEPGAGRVFGLLNLHALPRRLTLDFSDLFKRGFSFDRIEGHFTLIDSDAYTQDLVIEGPSARIDISGRIGLAVHDYDQLVTVTPEVSSGLPVAGALAGGPAVGAALFLADKLLGKQFQDIARYQYSVTGSWEDPEFHRLSRDEQTVPKENSP